MKSKTKETLVAAIDVAKLRGAPYLKALTYLALKGPATAENIIASGVFDLSPGNIRSLLSHCINKGFVRKELRSEARSADRGPIPKHFVLTEHGRKFIHSNGVIG